ncbi:MAG: patatin-like phospholipase family protein [Thermoleophilaceae bacterium]|nr:patatin-like phospholipase family protein [Thermoleophilaceae bacterium]
MPDSSAQPDRESIALVLAGGGARGAYEIGVLSELLPALPEDEQPNLLVGTSVGALNATFLASALQKGPQEALAGGRAIWDGLSWSDVLASPSLVDLERLLRGFLGFAGLPGMDVPGLLDPSPLEDTVKERIDFEQIEQNVACGELVGAAVVATSALSGRSVVFHCGGEPKYKRDDKRGIDYVATSLTDEHVRASSAIPTAFPAVEVTHDPGSGWYFDGGTRLNTPIKPALWFGAKRVIAIGLNSIAPGGDRIAGPKRPDTLDGAAQIVQALLADPLVEDVQTLTTFNDEVGRRTRGRRRLPYIFVAPPQRDTIGEIGRRCFEEHYDGLLDVRRSPQLALLGRILGGDADPVHGELLSYLFFAPEFAGALLEQGRRDGEQWVKERHDEGLWDVGPLGRDRGIREAGE